MGVFIDAEKLKARCRLDEIKEMDSEDIEDLLIRVAEARLEEAFDLDLNTDADPRNWAAHFESYPNKRTEFQRDMAICVILMADRIESNPHQHGMQAVRGSTVTFGPRMPQGVTSIMRRWGGSAGKTGRIVRT